MPIFGNAVSYPTGQWDVSAPAGMEDITSSSIGDDWTPQIVVVATPNADNIAWRFAQESLFIIEASRISSVQVFVLISILPLLLFFGLLALALLRSFISGPNRDRFPAELVIGLDAFLLAIIPVRAVLVPSE